MGLGQRLDLRQSQSLVMTPQLQQAIKLLQLSNLELGTFVEAELERNPLLEREDEAPPRDLGQDERPRAEDAPPSAAGDSIVARQGEAPLDTDFTSVWDDTGSDANVGGDSGLYASWGFGASRGGSFDDDDGFSFEQTLSGTISLRDHLLGQLHVDVTEPRARMIGAHLIDSLDETGWLTTPLDVLAERLGCPVAEVEAAVATVQRFDPPGICARSLKECLELQLRDRNRYDPAMAALLDNLELLAARNTKALLKICGVDAEDLAEMAAEIRRLNPKPALQFGDGAVQGVVPDVLMRPAPDGGWHIELNAETLPRVLVNATYYTHVRRGARNAEEREFLTEQLNSANWLVKALHQRATTILKVASEIVAQQDAFFRQGVSQLRPLILRDIADVIGMHESTVSRVTTNKFLATPRGLFELKYFFTAAIQGSDGDSVSAEAVRHQIRGLVDGETAHTVLSDDQIVAALRSAGVMIARRTVAKYRDAMRIPSSVQRRRMKSVGL
ncbi:MAG: RNA polymerase factor sigma-54 [Alphaproteobacteria bacterium]